MREIKFRAWVESEVVKNDIYPYMNYRIIFSGSLINDIFAMSGVQVPNKLHNKITYMQYTGIKDSKGVEIYEKDIVHLTSEEGIDYNAQIIFKDGGFCAIDGTEDDYAVRRYGLMRFELDVEVIGNFFENPELLL